jgi:hypothetical protein
MSQGLRYLDHAKSLNADAKSASAVRLAILSNMGACAFKLNNWADTVKYATEVLMHARTKSGP